MTYLQSLIETAITMKEGNKEFMLNYDPAFIELSGGAWSAEIGNPVSCVRLGESSGQFGSQWQPTPEAAVLELVALLAEAMP